MERKQNVKVKVSGEKKIRIVKMNRSEEVGMRRVGHFVGQFRRTYFLATQPEPASRYRGQPGPVLPDLLAGYKMWLSSLSADGVAQKKKRTWAITKKRFFSFKNKTVPLILPAFSLIVSRFRDWYTPNTLPFRY